MRDYQGTGRNRSDPPGSSREAPVRKPGAETLTSRLPVGQAGAVSQGPPQPGLAVSPAKPPSGQSFLDALMNPFQGPAAEAEAPAMNAEDRILAEMIADGIRDEVVLTNTLFFHRHPELKGTKLAAQTPEAKEWLAIRDGAVRTGLKAPLRPPAERAPKPAAAPAAATEAEASGDMMSSITSFFSSVWSSLTGGTEAPVEDAPAKSEHDGLEKLMSLERLTTDQIERARELIAELPPEQQGTQFLRLQAKSEYANQRDNQSSQEKSDGGTCNLTAVAMALKTLGVPQSSVTAAITRLSKPGDPAPSPGLQYEDGLVRIAELLKLGGKIIYASTWGAVAQELGIKMETVANADGAGAEITRPQWEAIRDAHLAAGKGVIISLRGHVIRLQAVNAQGLVVDDPYGASTLAKSKRRDRKDDKGNVTEESSKYAWNGSNSRTGEESSNKGEDVDYPWADVEGYKFGIVLAFTR